MIIHSLIINKIRILGIEKIFNFQNFSSEVGLNSVQPGQALVQAGQPVVQPGLNSVHSRFTSTEEQRKKRSGTVNQLILIDIALN